LLVALARHSASLKLAAMTDRSPARPTSRRRTALILASIAAAFFLGVIAKYWLLK